MIHVDEMMVLVNLKQFLWSVGNAINLVEDPCVTITPDDTEIRPRSSHSVGGTQFVDRVGFKEKLAFCPIYLCHIGTMRF